MVIDYLKDKLEDISIDYNELLKEVNYTKYGFRYINKIIDKYNSKINN